MKIQYYLNHFLLLILPPGDKVDVYRGAFSVLLLLLLVLSPGDKVCVYRGALPGHLLLLGGARN